ncbi:unnamed protein product [Miscanthus lutarioriparius]|uniref:Ribulose bisphosphate carboxylase/oxygenase activase, chloroplastic n=1 Tax=Miscanthus lutarioriparius TaxID=422564 RepID=A0A811QS46_9POAL|nr:unnamed protein product [Miscanthus lutarioriparius]
MATTSVAACSPHPHLSRPRRRNPSATSTSRASIRGRLPPIRCSSASSSPPPATGGEEGESGRRQLSKQSSWEAKDAEGEDYLYRLGKEADNLNVTVGARSGIVDDLFVGNFLGKDSDIVFDYRQKATRTFEYLQGDYYIAPAFLDKVGIWGGKGQGKTFQTELIFRAMGVEPVIMSAGELESEKAGEPGRLIRDRYRTASQVIQNQGKMSCLMINDLDAGVGRFGNTQMTVNNQIAVGTLMNLADNPNRASIGQKWRESDVTHRVPIIVTGNDFSTLYAPLIRDGRMEKFYWQPTREDIISIVHGMYRKDGLSVEEVARVVDAFPNQALDFYGALRSRTYDQAILEWVEEIGGHEQLRVKLLKRKKGEELPTFIPQRFTFNSTSTAIRKSQKSYTRLSCYIQERTIPLGNS